MNTKNLASVIEELEKKRRVEIAKHFEEHPATAQLRAAMAKIPKRTRHPCFDTVQKPIDTRHVSIGSKGLTLGNVFLDAVRDELYRKQYRDERTHPEWIDLGGES